MFLLKQNYNSLKAGKTFGSEKGEILRSVAQVVTIELERDMDIGLRVPGLCRQRKFQLSVSKHC